jgi:uncharacterized membrane protein
MSNKKHSKRQGSQKINPLFVVAILVSLVAILVVVIEPNKEKGNETSDNFTLNETMNSTQTSDTVSKNIASSDSAVPSILNENGDVVIQIADITESATFYSYDLNGTEMGLFAVMASDGTIRTALDTCQICSGSPYAYFVQQGDVFQCQNCGNIYGLDMIEQERGGCNPVPIMADEKTVTDTEIIIPAQLLEDNVSRFDNWKEF